MASTVDASRGKNNHVILNCFVLYGVCFVGVYLRTSTTASEVTVTEDVTVSGTTVVALSL